MFALVDAVLVRPLPFPDPERLVFVWETLPQHNVFEVEPTPSDYAWWHRLESVSGLALAASGTHTLNGGAESTRQWRDGISERRAR